MSKIRLKGVYKSPIVGKSAQFARIKFTVITADGLISGTPKEFVCDEFGNYDFELYLGQFKLETKTQHEVNWQQKGIVIVEPLIAGLAYTELDELIGYQEVPNIDEITSALNTQKQELLLIQQDVIAKQSSVTTAAANIDSTIEEVEAGYPSLLAAQLSKSVTVNVATGDDATADGSSAKPYKTIKKAIESQPDMTKVLITLAGGTDKATAHLINEGIDVLSRYVELAFAENHVVFGDAVTYVFNVNAGGYVHFSDRFGQSNIHVNTDKVFVVAVSECAFHLGGYGRCNIYVDDSAKITLLRPSYVSIRGVSRLTSSRLYMYSANNPSQPASAEIVSVEGLYAGSALINHWSASMGTNYKDFATASNVATIAGALKAVSN